MKRRIVKILVGTFAVMALIYGVVVTAMIYPRFLEIERHEAEQAMRRVLAGLAAEREALDVLVLDWASWDDTYEFVVTRSTEFINANLIEQTFIDVRLDLIVFLDRGRRMVWGRTWNRAANARRRAVDFADPGSPLVRALTVPSDGRGPVSGLAETTSGRLLLVARPILTSTNQGPRRGTLIMGRRFDAVAIEAVAARLRDTVAVTDPSVVPVRLPAPGEVIVGPGEKPETMVAHAILDDLFGAPLWVLSVTTPRHATAAGRTTLMATVLVATALALAVLLVVIGALDGLVVRPLKRLAATIIGLGGADGRPQDLPTSRADELGVVARAVREMHHAILEVAHRDSLTGLPNRLSFYERADHMLNAAQRNGNRVAFLLIDLNGFKTVNDTRGHQSGDLVLREVGRRLRGAVRESDVVARIGGDEFVILGEGFSDAETEIDRMAIKLLSVFRTPIEVLGGGAMVGASIGASLYPVDAIEIDQLLGCADRAMYAAKRQGGLDYARYGPHLAEFPKIVASQPVIRNPNN